MKKLNLLPLLMAFILLPLYSCFDEPNWMPDFDVHTEEVSNGRNYIFSNGTTNIYFENASPEYWLTGATILALGTIVHADSESIDMDIEVSTSFPHYLRKDRASLLQATIWNPDHSRSEEVRYYFYFFEQNGKRYYSYQRIHWNENAK